MKAEQCGTEKVCKTRPTGSIPAVFSKFLIRNRIYTYSMSPSTYCSAYSGSYLWKFYCWWPIYWLRMKTIRIYQRKTQSISAIPKIIIQSYEHQLKEKDSQVVEMKERLIALGKENSSLKRQKSPNPKKDCFENNFEL